MIKRYDYSDEGMERDELGQYVEYLDHLRYVAEHEKNELDFEGWIERIFPQADIDFMQKSDGKELIVTIGDINAQITVPAADWATKEGRMNAVQWVCKALLTELLNRCVKP